jgi:hypothetical protein
MSKGHLESGPSTNSLNVRQQLNSGWDYQAIRIWDYLEGRRPA